MQSIVSVYNPTNTQTCKTKKYTRDRRVQGKGSIGSAHRRQDARTDSVRVGISPDLVKDWKKRAKEMLGECFRRGGRKSEMEKKDERIANLERLLGKREFELDWLSKKAKELGL